MLRESQLILTSVATDCLGKGSSNSLYYFTSIFIVLNWSRVVFCAPYLFWLLFCFRGSELCIFGFYIFLSSPNTSRFFLVSSTHDLVSSSCSILMISSNSSTLVICIDPLPLLFLLPNLVN